MSAPLLAIALVVSSSKGSTLVCRWPPHPTSYPRLRRPRPFHDSTCYQADNPWRTVSDAYPSIPCEEHPLDHDEYLWRRPHVTRERSLSLTHARSHPASRRASPSKDIEDSLILDGNDDSSIPDEYDELLGYSAEFLASLLTPHIAMCHQKFELAIDDLAFLGHPVCSDPDGSWRFPVEKNKATSRGRGSRKDRGQTQSPQIQDSSLTPEKTGKEANIPVPGTNSGLQTFHLVLILDRPDPSSAASGNLGKYYDVMYEQIAFALTAVLYQEQVLNNFVEIECEKMGTLRDDCISRGQPYETYLTEAMKASTIALAMKTAFEALKKDEIANITIREFPLELQLPPYLGALLHSDDPLEVDLTDRENGDDEANDGAASWGTDMSFAWRLPSLTPWKALLRLDEGEHGYELYMKLRGPQLNPEDRELAEQLLRFLEMTTVTLCLADLASLLDWDLEGQVYPTVRWLVRHKRAKLVDVVHSGLRTIFALPQILPAPISALTADFERSFNHPSLPPFPKLLSQISTSTNTSAHFYGAVVRSRDMLPLYHEVVIWMLKRDLLITLHLRVRVFATPALKERVRIRRELALARQGRVRSRSISVAGPTSREESTDERHHHKERRGSESKGSDAADSSPIDYWMSMSPKHARAQARKMSPALRYVKRDRSLSLVYHPSDMSEKNGEEEDEDGLFDEDIDLPSSVGVDVKHLESGTGATIIPDPGRANAVERLWLSAMSEDKAPYIARRFEHISQYFDGKCSDDEILYKADISRKQLREVLHHYDEYLQTFLHPS
ncbi:nitrogen permease regulator of amino acid transport activity 3-domain-containing protein [Irpex rosettiformis]|uniref:Nitrogen permease regulator of amino acid transport activity 3-domain-containing protein n=1 Tax=Irpex rosettiformis TaxID=378272 RepID=A0ACB8TZH4_9APHY|nr:nitrogen permease regulator of amino acid transport activity 3-domain-containing protein [Irpex rosettiformis]